LSLCPPQPEKTKLVRLRKRTQKKKRREVIVLLPKPIKAV